MIEKKLNRAQKASQEKAAKGMVERRYTLKLYPSKRQEALLSKCMEQMLGITNMGISLFAERGRVGRSEWYGLFKKLRTDNPKYHQVGSYAGRDIWNRLDQAFKSYGANKRDDPQAKKPKRKRSDEFSGWDVIQSSGFKLLPQGNSWRFKFSSDQGVGLIRARGHVPKDAIHKNFTIKYDHPRKDWWVTIGVDVPKPNRKIGDKPMGMDLGLKTLITLVDEQGNVNEIANNCRGAKELHDHIENLARKMSRQGIRGGENNRLLKPTNGYERTRIKKAGLQRKLARQRAGYQHWVSSKLIGSAKCAGQVSLLGIEENGFSGMMAKGGAYKKGLNKSFAETGLSSLLVRIKYKAKEAGVTVIEAPTKQTKPTQTCSGCGFVNEALRGRAGLSIREWVCQRCDAHHDRDVNAAQNNLKYALGVICEHRGDMKVA